MHGNLNENQRNNMIDPPHLGKTTFCFLFCFLFLGGGGGRGGGVMRGGMDLFELRKMILSSIYGN